jgi:predicted acyl esterase
MSYTVVFGEQKVSLRVLGDETRKPRILTEWQYRPGHDPAEWHDCEASIVADQLRVAVDGIEIGTWRDTTLSEPGKAFLLLPEGARVARLEFLSLDGVLTAER